MYFCTMAALMERLSYTHTHIENCKKKINTIEGLRERNQHLNIFLFPPITQW